MFLAPKFFWGGPPKIFDRHYKTWPSTDQHAKFCANRKTHLRDLVLTGKIFKNQKFGAKPNVSPSGTLSPIGEKFQGVGVIFRL